MKKIARAVLHSVVSLQLNCRGYRKLVTANSFTLLIIISFLALSELKGQARTITTAGDWNNAGIWSGSNIGDDLGETVTFNNNIGTITIPIGVTITVGEINMNSGNTLVINGTLNVGDGSNADDLVTNNSTTITVDTGTGSLTVWGDLVANNNVTLGLGQMTIKGNLDMNNGATMDITGTVQIDGDFLAGTNADVTINSGGVLNVEGSYNVGNGSVMTGDGVATGDPCTGPVDFCINSPLPVTLVYFSSTSYQTQIELRWKTSTELNNDHFDVERSEDGINFYKVGHIIGKGTTDLVQLYSFTDKTPIAHVEYYRLKQVDFDGAFEYSKVIVGYADKLASLDLKVYPNPASEVVFLKSDQPVVFKHLQLINLAGQKVMDLVTTNSDGFQTKISLPNLESGYYFLQYETSSGESGTKSLAVK